MNEIYYQAKDSVSCISRAVFAVYSCSSLSTVQGIRNVAQSVDLLYAILPARV